jgi:HlyD family secretion protein
MNSSRLRNAKLWQTLALVVVLAGFAWAGWRYTHHMDSGTYVTAPIEKGNITATVSATGTTSAVVTVQVGSQVSGNIKELHADFNSKVKKGDLVALIDPSPFEARANQAQAALEAAHSAVLTAQANAAKVQSDIASARAQKVNLQADVERAVVAERDSLVKANRRQDLFKQLLIAQEDLDTARATYDSAVASRKAAEAQVQASDAAIRSVESQYQVALAQVESAKAQVRQAQAALEQTHLDLSHTRITAPVDGVVISRNVDVGQTVAASFSAPTIFVIAQDLTRMQVDTSVDEADIGNIQPGQMARFSVDAFPGRVFEAAVNQIRQAPITVQNVVTYDVVIAVANPDLKLFPGMTANVRIQTAEHEGVLRIPNAALRFQPAGAPPQPAAAATPPRTGGRKGGGPRTQTIYTLKPDGTLVPVTVRTGLSDGRFTEIESKDIREGDRVVISASGSSTATPAPRTTGRGPGF